MKIKKFAKGAGVIALSAVTAIAFSSALAIAPQQAEAKTTKSMPKIKIKTGMSGYEGYVFGPHSASEFKNVSGVNIQHYVKTAKIKGKKLFLKGSGKHLYKGKLKKGHHKISYSHVKCKQTFKLNKLTKYYKVTRVNQGKFKTTKSSKKKIQKLLNEASKTGTYINRSSTQTADGKITISANGTGYALEFSVSGKTVKKLYILKETASASQTY